MSRPRARNASPAAKTAISTTELSTRGGLAAAAPDELHEVEDREDGEGQGLQGDDGCRHQRGRAKGWDRGAVGAHEDRA